MSEEAFVRAFRAEIDALAHLALVEEYVRANSGPYSGAPSPELRERAEAWAKRIEDSGETPGRTNESR